MKNLEVLINESIKEYMNNIIKESSYSQKVGSLDELINMTNEKKEEIISRMQNKLDTVNGLFARIISIAQKLNEEIITKYNIQPNQISCERDLETYTIRYFVNGSEQWSEDEYYQNDGELDDIVNAYMPRTEYSDMPLRNFFDVNMIPQDRKYNAIGNEKGYQGAIIEISWDIYDLLDEE